MSFPYKDNTNDHGEELCCSCMYAHLVHTDCVYHCDIDAELHNNVGICNKYKGRCENG